MNSEQWTNGLLTYVVFLFSTTCHEAAHAYVALRGGDDTAAAGGQVSLNPWPHVRREPFGMVVLPLLSLLMGGGMIGWASAPYNPEWQRKYPKRAALMSLAGPAMNFFLGIACGLLLRVGIPLAWFQSGGGEGAGVILSIGFSLNLLLGIFNMLPFPPFDGYGVLGFLTGSFGALERVRLQLRQFAIIGLLVGWQAMSYVYPPIYALARRVVIAR
jgi:Zn-dependent protease